MGVSVGASTGGSIVASIDASMSASILYMHNSMNILLSLLGQFCQDSCGRCPDVYFLRVIE